jgi:hypothetical protein
MLSAKLLYLALPLLSLLDAGVFASSASQTPLDSAAAPITHRIHPGHIHRGKCLDVRGAAFENGTPVQM